MYSDDEQKTRSEQVRIQVVKSRRKLSRFLELLPISIDQDLIADTSDNTLRASFFASPGAPLLMSLEEWNEPPIGDTKVDIQISRDGGEYFTETSFGIPFPYPPGFFPHEYSFPRSRIDSLGEGRHRFRYTVSVWSGTTTSEPLTLRFDLFPPYRNEKPAVLTPSFNPVTDAKLAASNDTLLLSLPAYDDWEPGDRVRWYWFDALPEDGGPMLPLGDLEVPEGGMDLEVPGDHIRRVGDGGCFAWYELRDKAGYVSKLSQHVAVGVALGVLPPPALTAPEVNLASAEDGYLIDTADAALGVEIEVTLPSQIKPSDRINLHWGGADLGWRPLGNGASLRRFPVPLSILSTQYFDDPVGAATRTTGDKPTRVSYDLMRGTVPLGEAEREIRVNFEVVGPLDPEWPSPISGALLPPTVRGAVSDKDNVLTLADAGQPVSVTFTLFEGVEADDVYTFYWGAELITEVEYEVPAGAGEGDEVTLEMAWEVIETWGNGEFPVHYRVTRPGVPNSPDSAAQNVVVDAFIIMAKPVEFIDLIGGAGWSCSSYAADPGNPVPGQMAARIQVPPIEPAPAVGTVLTLSWRVVENFMGGGAPIPGVSLDDDITLTAAQISNGFTWYVSYCPHILPIYAVSRYGRATVHYSYDGPGGNRITSEPNSTGVAPGDTAGICSNNCGLPPPRKG